jgi:hypothetical protein
MDVANVLEDGNDEDLELRRVIEQKGDSGNTGHFAVSKSKIGKKVGDI